MIPANSSLVSDSHSHFTDGRMDGWNLIAENDNRATTDQQLEMRRRELQLTTDC